MTTPIDLHRPLQGDVIELILADHYLFEDLLRRMRNSHEDRASLREAFATLHVAHARAEELHVLPALKRRAGSVGAHEVEHGEEEHAEGHEALLELMELKGTGTQAFDDALEELSAVVSHHLVEEELTILNPARDEVGERKRAQMGAAFAAERNRRIDDGPVSLDQLRELVDEAREEGMLDD
jgi:Hemerythrin HHE cation binding domain